MKAEEFISILKNNGIENFTGVPCSVFKEVIAYLEYNEGYITASSEGEAMGIAAGLSLANNIPAVFMQNDGLGNAINPLTSLTKLYELPTLLVISWRGEPGKKDAPQHLWSGKTLLELMDIFEIEYLILEDNIEEQSDLIKKLISKIKNENKVCAIICRKEIFEKQELNSETENYFLSLKDNLLSREEAIKTILANIDDETLLFSTTGKISREVYKLKPRKNNFYTVGSMGCTSAIALGVYRKRKRKTIVLDGDGAVLMKMGTLATIGYYEPDEFLHICLDNESYESTGGQRAVSRMINLSDVAKASGYKCVDLIKTEDDIKEFMGYWNIDPFLAFLHIKVKNVTDPELGRPKENPVQMKKRFMDTL